MSSTGLVYILTNPCLDGWIKIGMTEKTDITERLKELNQPSNIPLSYQCYATYEVENPLSVEQCVHRLIDKVDLSLHARETLSNGKIRKREFFRLAPETAYSILQEVATLRNDSDNLKLYTVEEVVNEQVTTKKHLNYRDILKNNTIDDDSVIDNLINDTFHNRKTTQVTEVVEVNNEKNADTMISKRRRLAGSRVERRKSLRKRTTV